MVNFDWRMGAHDLPYSQRLPSPFSALPLSPMSSGTTFKRFEPSTKRWAAAFGTATIGVASSSSMRGSAEGRARLARASSRLFPGCCWPGSQSTHATARASPSGSAAACSILPPLPMRHRALRPLPRVCIVRIWGDWGAEQGEGGGLRS
jgi:hypothetical protein